eukprot:jgi/Ulvmu1/9191/UM005_0291.1
MSRRLRARLVACCAVLRLDCAWRTPRARQFGCASNRALLCEYGDTPVAASRLGSTSLTEQGSVGALRTAICLPAGWERCLHIYVYPSDADPRVWVMKARKPSCALPW